MGRCTRFASIAAAACALFVASSARAQGSAGGSTSSSGGSSADIGGAGNAPARPTMLEKELTDLPQDARVVPRGPTIPDIEHTAAEASIEQTIASVNPKPGGVGTNVTNQTGALTSHLFKIDAEIPSGSQVFYVGAQYEFAAARAPAQQNARFVSGQPELFTRVVHGFVDDAWAVGAGFGVMPPIVTYDDLDEAKRVQTATASALVGIVRPWDLSMFFDRRVTARPWIDLRVGRHELVAQFRQGLDVAMRTGTPSAGSAAGALSEKVGDIELVSVSTLFLGWQPTRELSLGVEAWEVYLLKTSLPISDRDRTVFAVSPGVRFFYRWVEPGVSLLLPIGAPLLGAVDNYAALRVDMRIWFDR